MYDFRRDPPICHFAFECGITHGSVHRSKVMLIRGSAATFH